MGKTFCAINIARYRIQNNNVTKVLVLCPTSIIRNWKKEIERFSEYTAIEICGDIEERRARIKLAKDKFHILNYEMLFKLKRDIYKKYDMIIFDESSRYIKKFSAKRTKAALAIAPTVKYRLILTGSIITNKPLDLWSQIYVLDGGKSLGYTFDSFKKTYFRKIKRNWKGRVWQEFKIRPDKVQELNNKVFNLCIMKRKREVLPDLPARHNKIIYLPMSKELNALYKETEKAVREEIYQIMINGKVIAIKSIFTKLLRLQQITSGFTKDQNGELIKLNDTPKLDAIIEEVESINDADESVVIFCNFLNTIDLIKERLNSKKIKYITMSGKDKDKYSKWRKFQISKIPVFICQIEAGGIGINLFKEGSTAKTQHMIYAEQPMIPDQRVQSEGRIDRLGQNSEVCYIDFIIENSIDERILNSRNNKQDIIDSIISPGGKINL